MYNLGSLFPWAVLALVFVLFIILSLQAYRSERSYREREEKLAAQFDSVDDIEHFCAVVAEQALREKMLRANEGVRSKLLPEVRSF